MDFKIKLMSKAEVLKKSFTLYSKSQFEEKLNELTESGAKITQKERFHAVVTE